jgi:hypothetical protein
MKVTFTNHPSVLLLVIQCNVGRALMRHVFNFYAHQYNQVEKAKLIRPEVEKEFKKPSSVDARQQANKHPYLIQVFRTKLQNKEKEKAALSKRSGGSYLKSMSTSRSQLSTNKKQS